jgi:hypothetical protein
VKAARERQRNGEKWREGADKKRKTQREEMIEGGEKIRERKF